MTHRERVLLSISHQEPDRVPIDLGGFQSGMSAIALKNLRDYLGMNFDIVINERVQQLAQVPDFLLENFGIDTRYVFPNGTGIEEFQDRDAYQDEWGIVWEKRNGVLYYEMVSHPLAPITSMEEFKKYPLPQVDKEKRVQGIRKKAQQYRENEYALFTSIAGNYDQTWNLIGLERFLADTLLNREFIVQVYEKVTETQMNIYGAFFEEVGEFLDVVEIWEDLTNQMGPMISPQFYQKYFKSLDKQYIDYIKSKTNAHIALHCCGSAIHFIPDFIDIGVEILNPVQVSAKGMDTNKLKKEYGKYLTFWGGIDTQYILPRGTINEVQEEVKKRIDDLAPGGGYLLASVHNIQADVPPQNIITMYETALGYQKRH